MLNKKNSLNLEKQRLKNLCFSKFNEFLGFTRKDLKDIFFATDKMIKKMQDTNFIKIKKTIRVEMPSAFGKVDMYLYDIETIYKITMAKYNKWLKENNYI